MSISCIATGVKLNILYIFLSQKEKKKERERKKNYTLKLISKSFQVFYRRFIYIHPLIFHALAKQDLLYIHINELYTKFKYLLDSFFCSMNRKFFSSVELQTQVTIYFYLFFFFSLDRSLLKILDILNTYFSKLDQEFSIFWGAKTSSLINRKFIILIYFCCFFLFFGQQIFEARDPQGPARTGGQQAGYQLLTLLITLLVAVVTGLATGKTEYEFFFFFL